VSDKTGWKGRGQQLRDSGWGTRDPVPRPGTAKENNDALEPPERVYSVGLLGPKTEIPTKEFLGRSLGINC